MLRKPDENTNNSDDSLLEGITHKPCVVCIVIGEHGGRWPRVTEHTEGKASCPLQMAGYFTKHPAAISSTIELCKTENQFSWGGGERHDKAEAALCCL